MLIKRICLLNIKWGYIAKDLCVRSQGLSQTSHHCAKPISSQRDGCKSHPTFIGKRPDIRLIVSSINGNEGFIWLQMLLSDFRGYRLRVGKIRVLWKTGFDFIKQGALSVT
jgi:hypothetical protein